MLNDLIQAIQRKQWDHVHAVLNGENKCSQTEFTDGKKRNALHHLSMSHSSNGNNVPLEVMKSIVSASSNAPFQEDAWGRTPLHYAAIKLQCDACREILIDACPRALFMVDYCHATPLDYAISNNMSATVIKQLLSKSIGQGFRGGDFVRPFTCFVDSWETDLEVVLRSHEASQTAFMDVSVHHHFLSEMKVCDIHDIILLFIRAYNGNTKTTSPLIFDFDTMKQIITDRMFPLSIFKMMLNIYPYIVKHQDKAGNRLIHIACSVSDRYFNRDFGNCDRCGELFNQSSYYDCVAIGNLCKECFFTEELDQYEYEFTSFDDKIPSIINILLSLDSTAASIPNNNGKLPLHICIEKNNRLEAGSLWATFGASPMALSTRDVESHLYPFMLQASVDCRPGGLLKKMNLCFDLLIENPTLVSYGIPN